MRFFCEALIDQHHYIGEDPIGYSCSNPAKWCVSLGDGRDIMLCDGCKALLLESPERVTLIPYSSPERR